MRGSKELRDQLTDALKSSTADYAEIRVESLDTTNLAYRGPEVESASTSSRLAGIARACVRGGWGIVTFETLDNLADRVAEACKCAELVGKENTELVELEPVNAENGAQLDHDFRGVSLDQKLRLIEKYNTILLDSAPHIESSQAFYHDSFRKVWFASTHGHYFMEERPRIICVLAAVARDGAVVQSAHESFSSATTYDVVLGHEALSEEISKRASNLLKAPKPDGGPSTIIMDHMMGGVFVHEAFGHMSEADFIHENPPVRELMHIGREIGAKQLNVVDDGSYPRSIGTNVYDDEGTPTAKTYLIKDGVLSAHLHSLETAAKMGVKPTGNARAMDAGHPPIVRMTNTYIEPGSLTVDELFAGVDNGIYACGTRGGQTTLENFNFTAAYGYRIRNGKKAELLRDVSFSGNLFETLKSVDGLADDFKLVQAAGGCGKSGQGAPVGFGSPHVRIRDVVVGGG